MNSASSTFDSLPRRCAAASKTVARSSTSVPARSNALVAAIAIVLVACAAAFSGGVDLTTPAEVSPPTAHSWIAVAFPTGQAGFAHAAPSP